MGLKGSFEYNGKSYVDAYGKIIRIWGSKSEGWNAWIGLYANKEDQLPATTVHVQVPFVEDENPYRKLYEKAKDFLSMEDHFVGVVEEPLVEPVTKAAPVTEESEQKVSAQPKKGRAKKNNAQ